MDDFDGAPIVVYEDDALVAVRKPARMHSAPGQGPGDLCAWVFERFPDTRLSGADTRLTGEAARRRLALEGGLLHRLDYETSGIVLFARNDEAFDSLLRQQEEGGFYKEYRALSTVSAEAYPLGSQPRRGIPRGIDESAWNDARDRLDGRAFAAMLDASRRDSRAGTVLAGAFRSYGSKGSRVACLSPAETGLGVVGTGLGVPTYVSDILSCGAGSPMEIRVGLSRGFRHQVRAQLAWIGLPISGDLLYGGTPDDRLRLYAVSLSFGHPDTGQELRLTFEE